MALPPVIGFSGTCVQAACNGSFLALGSCTAQACPDSPSMDIQPCDLGPLKLLISFNILPFSISLDNLDSLFVICAFHEKLHAHAHTYVDSSKLFLERTSL